MWNRIKCVLVDFWRYMDTTCPPGANREKYTELKYANKDKLNKLHKAEPLLDKMLVVDLALKNYLERDIDIIFQEARWYYGEDSTSRGKKE